MTALREIKTDALEHFSILKTEKELQTISHRVVDFLKSAQKLSFWRTHFTNHHFIFNAKKFNWDYWQEIPFLTIGDLTLIGLEPRLADASLTIQQHPYRFVLRIPYRKVKEQQLLFLDAFPKRLKTGRNIKKVLLTEFFGIALSHILLSLHPRQKNSRLLTVQPAILNLLIKLAVEEFRPTYLFIDPHDLPKFVDVFANSDAIKRLKKITLARSMEIKTQIEDVKKLVGKTKVIVQRPFAAVSSAIKTCRFAQKRFGFDVVHPSKHTIVELLEIDQGGFGEVVITIMLPLQLAWIRYRTEIFGKAVFKPCKCGNSWNLILKPVRKFYLSNSAGN